MAEIYENLIRHYAHGITPKRVSVAGPSPRLSTWATQFQRNIAALARLSDLTGLGIERQTSCADNDALTTTPINA